MNVVIGMTSARVYSLEMGIKMAVCLNPDTIWHFIEIYSRVPYMQISWVEKGGSIKTKVDFSKKLQFKTVLDGVTYHSDNIYSVVELIKKHCNIYE